MRRQQGNIDHGRKEAAAKSGSGPLMSLLMSLVAGLSTTVGAVVSLMLPSQEVSGGQMAFSLALAAGVMLSVTVLEFWVPVFTSVDGAKVLPVLLYTALGIGAFLLLTCLIPEPQLVDATPEAALDVEAPASEPGGEAEPKDDVPQEDRGQNAQGVPVLPKEQSRRLRLAFVLMLALTAHNFPEGFAVGVSALESNKLGFQVMIAIAIHNVPEGISIALPVFAATGSRVKAFWMSFLSGISEPVGAGISILVVHLSGNMSDGFLYNLLCGVGGAMFAVAVKELLPEAYRQHRPVAALSGLVAGILIMYLTIRLGA